MTTATIVLTISLLALFVLYSVSAAAIPFWPNNLNNADKIRDLEELAKKGNSTAQYHLGTMYRNSTGGVNQDYNKTFELYMKAAEQGNDVATL